VSMDFIERKATKLLARGQRVLGDMTAETLCDEPQKPLIRAMLAELREMLDEFEDAYFDAPQPPADKI
jgi:hypothetical protein